MAKTILDRHYNRNFRAARLTVEVSGNGPNRGRLIERLRTLLRAEDRKRVQFIETRSRPSGPYFHLHGPSRPVTVTFCGPMCTGKTTIVRELQQRLTRAELDQFCFAETVAPERPA